VEPTLKPTLQLSAGRAAAFAVTFLVPLALVRVFDPTEFGTYKHLFLVFSTVYAIGQIGMAESLFYFVPRWPGRSGSLVANSLAASGAAGLVAGLALWLLAAPIARALGNPELAPYLPWLGAFVALTLASAGLEIVLIARKRHLAAAVAYFASEAAKGALLLVPALVVGSLRALLVGAVLFAGLRAVSAVIVYRGELPGGLRTDGRLLRDQLAYAGPFAAAVTVEILQANWHQYVVSSAFPPAVFAIYAVGCLQVPFIDFVASPACNVMMVGMRESLERDRRDLALRSWRETTARVALLVVPMVAGLMVVAPELIVVLFTETYRASVPIFLVWTAALALAVLQTDGVLRVWAETKLLLALYAGKLVLIAATIHLFLDRFGLPGAALVMVVATAAFKAASLVRIRRLLGAEWRELLPWGHLAGVGAVAALAALAGLGVRGALAGRAPLLVLAATATTFAAVWAVLTLAWWRASRRTGWMSLPIDPRPDPSPLARRRGDAAVADASSITAGGVPPSPACRPGG
jgi:O-antigen/teichoic acid export membrane protein